MEQNITTVVIGAGQSGLAMSQALSQRSIEHVVLERGEVANSWREDRWDSLRLLTRNEISGVPGLSYAGDDPNGFMGVPELIDMFEQGAAALNAPVRTQTNVLSVTQTQDGYYVKTDKGTIYCKSVVMANGAFAIPSIPGFAADLPSELATFTPSDYKRPSDLPEGGVMVVGASASGQQIAREIQQAGHKVLLSVGTHLRLPRTYRGVDTMKWMEILELLSIPYTEVDDVDRVRRTPSPTLVADETLDLNILQDMGVEITGRLAAVRDGKAVFSGSLANVCNAADLKMNRLLSSIDEHVTKQNIATPTEPPQRYKPTRIPKSPRLTVDLVAEGFRSVVWATGYRPDFSWLDMPVFDRKGRLEHDGGYVCPGLYVLGLPYLRQRKSTFLAGAQDDAEALAAHLVANLGRHLAA